MTVGEWLRSRHPAPPAALALRLESVMAGSLDAPDNEAAERCMEACERVAASLFERDGSSRDSALDLLAADALVTYAFEAAAEQPDGIGPLAASAMRRIGLLASDTPR